MKIAYAKKGEKITMNLSHIGPSISVEIYGEVYAGGDIEFVLRDGALWIQPSELEDMAKVEYVLAEYKEVRSFWESMVAQGWDVSKADDAALAWWYRHAHNMSIPDWLKSVADAEFRVVNLRK